MIDLGLAAVVAASVLPLKASANAKVGLRVIRAATIDADTWAQHSRKVERVIIDEQGRKFLLRLVEFE